MCGGEVNASTRIVEESLENVGATVNEMQIHLVPVLLGDGARLFEHLDDAKVELESIRAVVAPGVTDITYRVVK